MKLGLAAIGIAFAACAPRGVEWSPSYEELTTNEGAFSASQIGIPPDELPPLAERAATGDHEALSKIQQIAPIGDAASAFMDTMLLGKLLEDAGDEAYSAALAEQTPEVKRAHSRLPELDRFPLTKAVTVAAAQVGDGDA